MNMGASDNMKNDEETTMPESCKQCGMKLDVETRCPCDSGLCTDCCDCMEKDKKPKVEKSDRDEMGM